MSTPSDWTTSALGLRATKLLHNFETKAADLGIEGTPVYLHHEAFLDAFGERAQEAIDCARVMGWIEDAGPTAARHYRLTEAGRESARTTWVIGNTKLPPPSTP